MSTSTRPAPSPYRTVSRIRSSLPSSSPPQGTTNLLYDFLRLRDAWPHRGIEIKGSKLDETQTAQVAALLLSHGALVEFCAVDMSFHGQPEIDAFKEAQGASITASLTPDHQPMMARQLHELAATIRGLSNRLFIQAFLTIILILETIRTATLYFVQRCPAELDSFTWTIDRKDRSLTQMERVWTTLILPMAEFQFAKHPLSRLKGADYSYFTKYEVHAATATPEVAEHLLWIQDTYYLKVVGEPRAIDPRRLFTEQQSFADSRDYLGLQLADITATTLRRALNGQLQQWGWEGFGRLLILKQDKRPIIRLGDPTKEQGTPMEGHLLHVWQALRAQSQAMLLPDLKH